MKVKFLDGREKEFETLAGADLRGADLRNSNLKGKSLCGADLMCANMKGANLGLADLMYANMKGANLELANLTKTNLRGACLRNTYLWNANLRGADLRGADMEGAVIHFADLRGAVFEYWVVSLGALSGAVLDKEQYARLRDILDKLGKTVDDEGTRAQVMRDVEIHGHYDHAKEKHPVFADILATSFPLLSRHYKAYIQARHETGECTPVDVLWGECLEVFEAVQARDKAQAVYECYDCIAVLLRLIDMIEETAEKEGWKEERG